MLFRSAWVDHLWCLKWKARLGPKPAGAPGAHFRTEVNDLTVGRRGMVRRSTSDLCLGVSNLFAYMITAKCPESNVSQKKKKEKNNVIAIGFTP